MQCSLEQRIAIEFCVKLGKSAVETFPMIKTAFGDNCLSERQVYRGHNVFLEGCEEVSDEARAVPPSTTISDENVTRARYLLYADPCLSIRLVAQTVNIPKKYRSRDFDE